jgi:two-component system, cell cycle sensor histidine kinase and response regulator CckA
MRILYVEDDARDADLARLQLAKQAPEIRLEIATSLHEARARLAHDTAFDLVLTDLRLPDGTGLELLSEIRSRGWPFAVVVVTGSGDEDSVVAALRAGADDYLTKRDDYLTRLPQVFATALTRVRTETERRAHLLRILYVEHKSADISLTRFHLGQHAPHLLLEVVESAEDALQRLPATSATTCPFDLLLVDYRLPGLNGLELMKIVREERHLDVPVVLITGQGDEQLATQALRLGAADYLVKRPGYLFKLPFALENVCHRARLERDEAALRASEARTRRLSEIIESTPDFVGMFDAQGQAFYVNRGGRQMTGLTDDEDVSHLRIEDLHPPEVAARISAQALPTADHDGSWSGETIVCTRDGRAVPGLQVIVAHKKSGDRVEFYSTIIREISVRKKLEAQLLRTQRLESVGRLANGIAHDLNNILAPMLIATPMLRNAVRDSPSSKIVDIIDSSAKRGAAIIRQLLTFSRGVEGRRAPLQLKALVREMELIMAETFPKNIRVQVATPADTWLVTSDPTQLHQVMMNLCVNARDAMPRGGTLTLGLENITLDPASAATLPGAQPGRYVTLSVTDTGTGIAPEHLDKIYDPFFTTKEIGRGTGLGLSTVLGIAKSHQGFIHVESELGQGTRFQVFLPACTVADEAPVPVAQDALPPGQGELVLVVDDEENVRQMMCQILDAFGYHVIDFNDATAALDWYKLHGQEAAAVITDMMMPGMDGAVFLRELRRLNPQVRVIAASGNQQESPAADDVAAEVKAILTKPFTVEMLLQALQRVLHPPSGA